MNPRPTPTTQRLALEGPAGPLESLVDDAPAGGGTYAVVCHPHPLHGGTMDNKVVTTVARALLERAIPTIRFNFRGVGASGGSFDDGRGETLDAAAIATWGAQRWPGRLPILAGFSFGSYVACRLAQEREVAHVILVAPPVGRFDFPPAGFPRCPWLVVQGEADEVVEARKVRAWALAGGPNVELRMLPGVGHFFHGRLHELRDAVTAAIQSG